MIEFCDVTYKYHYDEFSVLERTSFVLKNGANTLLCNYQSGKTTICKLILGLLQPQSGSVSVDGQNPRDCAPDVLYLPKKPILFQNRSVLFNLNYPLKVRKILPQRDVFAIAERFGLSDKLRKKAKTLTEAEQLRLSLARGLTVLRKTVLFDGFFDHTLNKADGDDAEPSVLQSADIFDQFQTVVVLTDCLQNAVGNAVVLDGKRAVFSGTASEASKVAEELWIRQSFEKQ